VQDSRELVVVRLGGCRYALPLSGVAEVGRPPSLTRVPGLPGWVAGVANWRGRVLALLDLRPLLGAGRDTGEVTAQPDRRGRVVVLSTGTVTAGLLVEAVIGTIHADPAQVEPALAGLPDATAALLTGHVTDPDGLCGLLDLAAVLALADTLPRVRRAG
jgi:purine-binding chemotaxis protein CheW